MDRVTAVRALPTYRLEIEFSDGVRGVLDYEDRLFGLLARCQPLSRSVERRIATEKAP